MRKGNIMRNMIFAVLLIALIGVTGCQNGNKDNVGDAPYVGGTTALVVDFTQDAPPDTIYDGNSFPFDIDVKLKNSGEFTIPANAAKVVIEGIYPNEYGKTVSDLQATNPDEIIGVTKDISGRILDGSEDHVTFAGLQYNGEISGAMSDVTLLAKVCYPYKTMVSSSICIRNPLRTTRKGVCDVFSIRQAMNSGAPVHVENIEESATGTNKIRITFDVVHKGTGKIFEPSSGCVEDISNSKENRVKVTVTPGIGTTRCTGLAGTNSGTVRLGETGKTSVSCTIEIPEGELSNFEKQIGITLEYDYQNTIHKIIKLKDSGQ